MGRRNPGVAALGALLAGVLVIATVCSLVAMERFRNPPTHVRPHDRERIAHG